MKAKKELKRISNKFVAYCKLHSFDVSAIKTDMKNGKTKIFRYSTPSVYGEMYTIHGNKHCTITRKVRVTRKN